MRPASVSFPFTCSFLLFNAITMVGGQAASQSTPVNGMVVDVVEAPEEAQRQTDAFPTRVNAQVTDVVSGHDLPQGGVAPVGQPVPVAKEKHKKPCYRLPPAGLCAP